MTGSIAAGWAVALVVLLIARDSLAAGRPLVDLDLRAGLAAGIFGFCYVPVLKRSRSRAAQRRASQRDGLDQAAGEHPAGGQDPAASGDPVSGREAASADPASGQDRRPGPG